MRARALLSPQPVRGGSRTLLGTGPVVASLHRYDAGAAGDVLTDGERATCLHVVEGAGQLVLGEAAEVRRTSPPAIAAGAGDLFLVVPGGHYGFVNDGSAPLVVAEQRIPPSTALV